MRRWDLRLILNSFTHADVAFELNPETETVRRRLREVCGYERSALLTRSASRASMTSGKRSLSPTNPQPPQGLISKGAK